VVFASPGLKVETPKALGEPDEGAPLPTTGLGSVAQLGLGGTIGADSKGHGGTCPPLLQMAAWAWERGNVSRITANEKLAKLC